MSSNDNNLVSDVSRALCADPKKTGLLSVLMIVLVVVVGRMAMNGRSGPSAANASSSFKGTATDSSRAGASSASQRNTSAISGALRKWSEGSVPPLSRNLFTVRIEYFPVNDSRTAELAPGEEGFWSRMEKSFRVQADQKDKRDNLVENFKAQAAQLKIESIMLGPQPRAMVNGNLVAEGSVVAEFRVLKIEPRRIVVEREGIKLAIDMK